MSRQIIFFLHPCHVPVVGSDRIEFVQQNAEREEALIPADWLSGALEYKFCERRDASPAAEVKPGDAPPAISSELTVGTSPAPVVATSDISMEALPADQNAVAAIA